MAALTSVTALKPFVDFLGVLPLLMLRRTQRKAYQPEWSSYVLVLLGAFGTAVPTSQSLADLVKELCEKLRERVFPRTLCIRHFCGHRWVDRPVVMTSWTNKSPYDVEFPQWTYRYEVTTSFERLSKYGLEYELVQTELKYLCTDI